MLHVLQRSLHEFSCAAGSQPRSPADHGGRPFAGFYASEANAPSKEDAKAVLLRALELGINFYNTSNLYGPYVNEDLIGAQLLRERVAERESFAGSARLSCGDGFDGTGVVSMCCCGPVSATYQGEDHDHRGHRSSLCRQSRSVCGVNG